MINVLTPSNSRKITGILFSFIIFISYITLHAQSLSVFDIDQSEFPKVRAKIYAFDKDGKQITKLSPSDFQVKENGESRKVLSVSCPEPKQPNPISIAMSFDVSGTMIYSDSSAVLPINLSKATAKHFAELLSIPPSEIALQICKERPSILLGFTKDKQKYLNTLSNVAAGGDNNLAGQLLASDSGLLDIAKNGAHKRVAVIFTHETWMSLNPELVKACIDTCKKYNVTLYAFVFTCSQTQTKRIDVALGEICDSTGGRLFNNVTTLKEAEDIALEIQNEVQGNSSCQIEWESKSRCSLVNIKTDVSYGSLNASLEYISSQSSIADLRFNPTEIYCLKKPAGLPFDTTITVTSINGEFNITNINSSNPAFDVTPKAFSLKPGQSLELNLRFTPEDSNYSYVKFGIENNLCPINYYASAGYKDFKKKNKNTLKLTYPIGGEVLSADSENIITWEGVLPSDTVKIEYSTDNGATWSLATDTATGLKYLY
jgi:hypothetical protein